MITAICIVTVVASVVIVAITMEEKMHTFHLENKSKLTLSLSTSLKGKLVEELQKVMNWKLFFQ